MDDLRDALVGAGGEAQEPDEQDEDVLDDGELVEARVLPADHDLDDRREEEGQGRAAYGAHQRDEQAQVRDRLGEDDCGMRIKALV